MGQIMERIPNNSENKFRIIPKTNLARTIGL